MRFALLSLFAAAIFSFGYTQNDSLLRNWQNTSLHDTVRAESYKWYIWNNLVFSHRDSAIKLSKELVQFAKDRKLRKVESAAYNLIGVAARGKGDQKMAIEYVTRSKKIREELGDKKGVSGCLMNLSNSYSDMGNNVEALNLLQQALDISMEINFLERSAGLHNNIGLIYLEMGFNDVAQNHFLRSIEIAGEKDMLGQEANAKNNLGSCYYNKQEYDSAMACYKYVLESSIKREHTVGIARALNNIGRILYTRNELDSAWSYFDRSAKIAKEANSRYSESNAITNAGNVLLDLGDEQGSIKNCLRGLQLAEEAQHLIAERSACDCLYRTYKRIGNTNETLKYLERIQAISDSMNHEETAAKLQQIAFASQLRADSLEKVEAKRMAEAQAAIEAEAKARKDRIQLSGIFIGVFLLFLIIVISSRVKLKPKFVSALIFIFFILLFELVLVVMDPWTDGWSSGIVWLKFAINSFFALVIFVFHTYSERLLRKWFVRLQ